MKGRSKDMTGHGKDILVGWVFLMSEVPLYTLNRRPFVGAPTDDERARQRHHVSLNADRSVNADTSVVHESVACSKPSRKKEVYRTKEVFGGLSVWCGDSEKQELSPERSALRGALTWRSSAGAPTHDERARQGHDMAGRGHPRGVGVSNERGAPIHPIPALFRRCSYGR
jgi:hypothetical protein